MTAVTDHDTFHEGERFVQERAGEREAALRNGGIVDDTIPSRAIPFLAQQRMLAVGRADAQGAVWGSLLFGVPGLASSVDGRSVVLDRTRIEENSDDPVWGSLGPGADVGLLAIEFASRRRLRINGVVMEADDRHVAIRVHQAYPNCPKYIQRRHSRVDVAAAPDERAGRASGVSLDEARSAVIERADTFFVASRHPTRGLDVSHRGGAPGFVRVVDASRLRIPDYPGNSMFNTFGNFAVDDRAGLVFLDFERRSLLQMSGTAMLRFDEPEEPSQPTGGTGRYWDFHAARWFESPLATRLTWDSPEVSPYLARVLEHSR